MTWREIQRVVDFAMEDWGLRDSAEKPRLHNDNGGQLKAKKLRQTPHGMLTGKADEIIQQRKERNMASRNCCPTNS